MNTSKSQLIKTFSLSLIPLVAYFIIDEFLGLVWGVIAAIAAGLIETLYYKIKYKTFDKLVIISTSLIVLMGFFSILFNSPVFIMLKPVLFEGIFGIGLVIVFFLKLPFMEGMVKKHYKDIELSEMQKNYMLSITMRMGLVLIVHAAVILLTIIFMSKKEWIFAKGVLFYVFFGVLFLYEMIYSKIVIRRKILKEQNNVFFNENLVISEICNEVDLDYCYSDNEDM